MKTQSVDTLKGGEILATDVIDDQNEILLEKGSVIKNEYIELLKRLEIFHVNLQDDAASIERRHDVMEKSLADDYIEHIQKILESHIYQEIYHGNHSLKKMKEIARRLTGELQKRAELFEIFDISIHSGSLYEHTFLVTALSLLTGIRMGLGEDMLHIIAEGCLLHNLGLRYVTVPYVDFVPEEHTAAEVFELKKHTILGYSALESATWLENEAKDMVLFHHERKDGSGYPLKQKVNTLECHIIQVCDEFCCKIFGMGCKKMTVEEAWKKLDKDGGRLFDKEVTDTLLNLTACYPVGTIIQNVGIVIEQTEYPTNPIVAVMDENGSLTGDQIRLEGETCTNI